MAIIMGIVGLGRPKSIVWDEVLERIDTRRGAGKWAKGNAVEVAAVNARGVEGLARK